jgi:hypothetical protein
LLEVTGPIGGDRAHQLGGDLTALRRGDILLSLNRRVTRVPSL